MSSPDEILPPEAELLQRYLDGDLDEAQAAQFEASLDADGVQMGELSGLRRAGELMRVAADDFEASLSEDESHDLFARIEAVIDGGEELASLDPEEEAALAEATAPAEPPKLRVLRGGGAAGAVVVAATLAAAAAFGLFSENTETAPEAPPTAQVEPPITPEATPGEQLARGSEVIKIDYGASTGTHFTVEGAQGHPVAVVWIEEREL